MAEPWAPGLDEVARHIPRRTRDSRSPGSDNLLGTFTDATTPNSSQAQGFIDAAVRTLTADVGNLPVSGDPNLLLDLQSAARDAVEWRAAADIELAYPNRDQDIRVAAQLDQRAKDSLTALRRVLSEAGAGLVEQFPVWMAPDPVTIAPWGDKPLL